MTIRGIVKSTNYFRRYWKGRAINWKDSYFTPNHPHRQLLIDALRQFSFRSVLEVGCAAGANLYKIKQNFPKVDVGGIDWNVDAIEEAKKMLPKVAVLQVGEATDIYISSKGSDIILTDMCYIYLDKKNFHKAIQEAKRVARVGIVLCEFHHPNWFMRQALKLTTGYNAYDYQKELERAGFYDIQFTKLTEQDWPGGEPQKSYGFVISARP